MFSSTLLFVAARKLPAIPVLKNVAGMCAVIRVKYAMSIWSLLKSATDEAITLMYDAADLRLGCRKYLSKAKLDVPADMIELRKAFVNKNTKYVDDRYPYSLVRTYFLPLRVIMRNKTPKHALTVATSITSFAVSVLKPNAIKLQATIRGRESALMASSSLLYKTGIFPHRTSSVFRNKISK